MRKAILIKFLQVLLVALLVNSAVFYLVCSSVILQNTRKNMTYTLEVMDNIIEYDEDLNKELEQIAQATDAYQGRFTLIDMNGQVIADTGINETDLMDNHITRTEIQDAIIHGSGEARRYSETLHTSMIYEALKSEHGDYILRLAIPYSGIRENLMMMLPAVWLSFAIAFMVSLGMADKFAKSVSQPLAEISREMLKVNGHYDELSFGKCQYPEIDVIADTTTEMSKNVKEYLNQIEKERQIRQEFFSNASHELKTPITSVQGYAELLESGMITDEATQIDFIKRIKKEAGHMNGLINDILMISRLETKEAEVVKSDVRMSLLLQDIIDSLKPMAGVQQVMIHKECQPITYYANLEQMKQLLGNLMTNAVKYNKPGGAVWVTIAEEGSEMVIRVKDSGMGIPQESISRIFERFYRVDKGRSRKQGGTGLGLAIVKHIVNYYNGSIQVDSKMEQGSEFTVKLPISSGK